MAEAPPPSVEFGGAMASTWARGVGDSPAVADADDGTPMPPFHSQWVAWELLLPSAKH